MPPTRTAAVWENRFGAMLAESPEPGGWDGKWSIHDYEELFMGLPDFRNGQALTRFVLTFGPRFFRRGARRAWRDALQPGFGLMT